MDQEAQFVLKEDKNILSIVKIDNYNKINNKKGISIFKNNLKIYGLNEENVNKILNTSKKEEIIYSYANIGLIVIKGIICFAYCTKKDVVEKGTININKIYQINNIRYIIINPEQNKKNEFLNIIKDFTTYEITKGLFFSNNAYKIDLGFDEYNNLYKINKYLSHISPSIDFCYNNKYIEYFKKSCLDDFISYIICGFYNNDIIKAPFKEDLAINFIVEDKIIENENEKIVKQIEIFLTSKDLILNQIFHFLFFCYIGDFLSDEKLIYNLLKKDQPEYKIDNGTIIIIDIKNKTKGKSDEEINEIIANMQNKLNEEIKNNNNRIIFIKQRDPINNIIEKNKDIFSEIKFNYMHKKNCFRELQEKQLLIITDNEMNFVNIVESILHKMKFKFLNDNGELLYENEINDYIKTVITNYRKFIKTKNNNLLKIDKIESESINENNLNKVLKINEKPKNDNNLVNSIDENNGNININQIIDEKNKLIKEEKDNNIISIYIVTSNVACYNLENENENEVEDSLKKLLFPKEILDRFSQNNYPTFYCIGLQEIIELNTSNVIFLKDKNSAKLWEQKISSLLSKNNMYTLQFSENLVGIYFLFFVKTSELAKIQNINKSVVKAGLFNKLGNKGYIIIEFKYNNKTFAFCTGHLEAGEKDKNYQSRVDQLVDILKYKNNKSPNRIFQNDFYFLFGDMNFRVKVDRENFFEEVNKINNNPSNKTIKDDTNIVNKLLLVKDILSSSPKENDKKLRYSCNYDTIKNKNNFDNNYNSNDTMKNKMKEDDDEDDIDNIDILNKSKITEEQFKTHFLKDHLRNDELTLVKNQLELYQVNEHNIDFLPTYKYIKKYNYYNVSKRVPSWTDRILFKKNKEIKCLCYNKIEVKYSDHRPVYALFEINMNKKKII